VRCEFGKLLESLTTETARRSALPLLRTYWYDASLTGQPEHDQLTIADLQGVRLRLGRLVRGEQKGVDSRIVRDLIVLARDRAIAEAYLLAGDEDLCEGVQEAQDQGVRVTLLAVPGVNQSRLLMQQADQNEQLPEAFWRSHFAVVEEKPAPVEVPEARASTANAVVTQLRRVAGSSTARSTRVNPAIEPAFTAAAARVCSGNDPS